MHSSIFTFTSFFDVMTEGSHTHAWLLCSHSIMVLNRGTHQTTVLASFLRWISLKINSFIAIFPDAALFSRHAWTHVAVVLVIGLHTCAHERSHLLHIVFKSQLFLILVHEHTHAPSWAAAIGMVAITDGIGARIKQQNCKDHTWHI